MNDPRLADDIRVVAFGSTSLDAPLPALDEADLVHAAVGPALAEAGVERRAVDFWCAGSCDYTLGKPFSFVQALDGLGIWPPKAESHVEMDGAWALYEAWVHLRCGHGDIAVAYAFGRSSVADLDAVWRLQMDPYHLAPLGVDAPALVALQAQAGLDEGRWTADDLDAIVAAAGRGPRRASPRLVGPLHQADRAHPGDGAAAVVLMTGARAESLGLRGARIAGIAHASEAHQPGWRALSTSPSTRAAALRAGVDAARLDGVEVHASWAVHVPIVRAALGLPPLPSPAEPPSVVLAGDTPQVSGLAGIGAGLRRITGGARSIAVHATNGPALQQNLVCRLEAP